VGRGLINATLPLLPAISPQLNEKWQPELPFFYRAKD
jgi:hypothetical protein